MQCRRESYQLNLFVVYCNFFFAHKLDKNALLFWIRFNWGFLNWMIQSSFFSSNWIFRGHMDIKCWFQVLRYVLSETDSTQKLVHVLFVATLMTEYTIPLQMHSSGKYVLQRYVNTKVGGILEIYFHNFWKTYFSFFWNAFSALQ